MTLPAIDHEVQKGHRLRLVLAGRTGGVREAGRDRRRVRGA
ncbi:hypothetical protein ABZ372_55920 [Streptomyces sp. NPDC005921]